MSCCVDGNKNLQWNKETDKVNFGDQKMLQFIWELI